MNVNDVDIKVSSDFRTKLYLKRVRNLLETIMEDDNVKGAVVVVELDDYIIPAVVGKDNSSPALLARALREFARRIEEEGLEEPKPERTN